VTTPAGDPANVTAPIPVVTGRMGFRATFSALGTRNYRLYALSVLVGSTGGWMSSIAISWLVVELTGNVALVGMVLALQLAPAIVLGPWAGVLSDRHRRRTLLAVAQVFHIVAMGSLALLAILGAAELWQVFLAAGVSGLTAAIDSPSRPAFLFELVGISRVRNAISLTGMSFHLGGLIGPAVSGLLIVAVGAGWSLAVSFVAAIVSVSLILVIRSRDLARAPRQPRSRGQIREALRYALRKPTIVVPLVLLAAIATFGMPLPVLLAEAAGESGFGTGAAGYGLYASLAAAGAVLGAAVSTRIRTLRLRRVVVGAAVYGVFTLLAGFAPWQFLFGGFLVGVGVSRNLWAVSADSMTQFSSNPGIRGRIMSFYMLVLLGGQALGGVIIGTITETFGLTVGFTVAGGGPLLTAIVVGLVLARRHQLRIQVDLRSPRRPVRIVSRSRPTADPPSGD
jgi:MFS family permease